MIKFLDKDGNIIHIDTGDPDLLKYPPSEHFPEGWTWEVLLPEELKILRPPRKGGPLPDPPHEAIRKMKIENDLLKEILEEELKHPKGYYQELIKDKLKNK